MTTFLPLFDSLRYSPSSFTRTLKVSSFYGGQDYVDAPGGEAKEHIVLVILGLSSVTQTIPFRDPGTMQVECMVFSFAGVGVFDDLVPGDHSIPGWRRRYWNSDCEYCSSSHSLRRVPPL